MLMDTVVHETGNDPSRVLDAFGLKGCVPGVWIGRRSSDARGPDEVARSPIDGRPLASVRCAAAGDFDAVVDSATSAFHEWRLVPAPQRGQFVRKLGERLRHRQADLAEIICWEVGKTFPEAIAEVQEAIDMCEYAVGQSR